jgi:voltage-gated sodium channel
LGINLLPFLNFNQRPQRYFNDRWNQIDLLIVLNGWARIINFFALEFLVVFRLVYLLRVLRVARAFPRLRSIVDALIEALAAVKWMVILICIFNYIAACCCMIVFSKHDPFYFGELL